jgi:quinoprotein glucose dehydrogenase
MLATVSTGFVAVARCATWILIGIAAAGCGDRVPRAASVEGAATQWPHFGGDSGGLQHTLLTQITAANVAALEVAWVHHSGDFRNPDKPKMARTSHEATPLHANDTLYYCTPMNRVFALDPATGREKWIFDPHSPVAGTGKPLYDKPRTNFFCRGLAYWESRDPAAGLQCEKRVFKPSREGHLYAIDAVDGTPCPDFGAAKGHPGYVSAWDYTAYGDDDQRGMPQAPLVVGDIVVATIDADDSVADANDGLVRGFDVRTGEMVWEFDSIPEAHRRETGDANVWGNMTADPKRGLVFVGTTSPGPDYFGGTRSFDMPHVNAIVALDARNGAVRWSFQNVHHDVWDYDNGTHPLLATIRKDGRSLDVAILQTKLGHLYVFDRDTGQSIWPIVERPVPKSDVVGEQLSPTQPYPVLPEVFAKQTLTRDDAFGLTPIDRAWCRKSFDAHRYEGMFTPPSARGSLTFPGPFGGGNWGGATYDSGSNLLVVKSQNLVMSMKLLPIESMPENEAGQLNRRRLAGTPYAFEGYHWLSPLGVPCNAPPWGLLTAIDMGTGKIAWQVPLGQARRYGITIPASFGWGSPNVGGPLSTAGGLVFIGASMDSKFRALDVRTGKELWSAGLPAPGMAVPMSYAAAGRQYVVIAAGGNAPAGTKLGDALVAFALPKTLIQ